MVGLVATQRLESSFYKMQSNTPFNLLSIQYTTCLPKQEGQGKWTSEEHERFMTGLELRPNISWKQIAEMVGTRTPRQTRTHAQKYYQKLERQRKRKERKNQKQMQKNALLFPSMCAFQPLKSDMQAMESFLNTMPPLDLSLNDLILL